MWPRTARGEEALELGKKKKKSCNSAHLMDHVFRIELARLLDIASSWMVLVFPTFLSQSSITWQGMWTERLMFASVGDASVVVQDVVSKVRTSLPQCTLREHKGALAPPVYILGVLVDAAYWGAIRRGAKCDRL
jgi:hypothetical protein